MLWAQEKNAPTSLHNKCFIWSIYGNIVFHKTHWFYCFLFICILLIKGIFKSTYTQISTFLFFLFRTINQKFLKGLKTFFRYTCMYLNNNKIRNMFSMGSVTHLKLKSTASGSLVSMHFNIKVCTFWDQIRKFKSILNSTSIFQLWFNMNVYFQ